MTKIKPYSKEQDRLVTWGKILMLYELGQERTPRARDLIEKYLKLIEPEE